MAKITCHSLLCFANEFLDIFTGVLKDIAVCRVRATVYAERCRAVGRSNRRTEALTGVLKTLSPFIEKAYMANIQCTVHFTDGSSHTSRGLVPVSVSDEQRQSLIQIYELNRARLLALSPQPAFEFLSTNEILEKENKKQASSSMCFVATACYGSGSAEPVMVLRKFRNSVLAESRAGRVFIDFYYKFGPYAADFIAPRVVLRVLVKNLLCAPAAAMARGVMAMKSRQR